MSDDTKPRPPHSDPPPADTPPSDDLPPEFREDLSADADHIDGRDWDHQPYDYHADDYPAPTAGPGCLMWSLVVVFLLLTGVAVVGMSGAAGWTEGRRVADRNIQATGVAFAERQLPAIETNVADLNAVQLATRIAFLATRTPGVPNIDALYVTATAVSVDLTATQEAVIAEQLTRIPDVVAAGDGAQLAQRLDFLAIQTPAVPGLADLQATATTLAESPVERVEAPDDEVVDAPAPTQVEATPAAEAEQEQPAPTETPSGPDLPELLARAQQQINNDELEAATRTLDIIIRLDESFQRQTVERLMFDTLRARAVRAYQVTLTNPRQTGTLAEAVRLTDQAELYGTPGQLGELGFEREAARLYLNAAAAIEAANYSVAIQRLERLRNLLQANNYKGADINRLLFNQYVAYGDAFFQFDRDYCRAAQQYRSALTFFNDANVAGKRDNAQTLCEQPPTPAGELAPGETPVAPIGVPGT